MIAARLWDRLVRPIILETELSWGKKGLAFRISARLLRAVQVRPQASMTRERWLGPPPTPTGRKMRDLNSKIDPNSDWLLTWAHAINNIGQILASGLLGSDDSQRAVLLTPVAPVPLPAVVWLMLSGWPHWAG